LELLAATVRNAMTEDPPRVSGKIARPD
jgi:hypothetical protein